MKETLHRPWHLPFLIILSFLASLLCACKPEPPIADLPIKKVIVSRLSEVTKDAHYVDDTIRYPIYYANNTKKKADIGIVDRLDPNLGKVVIFNGGTYDSTQHAVAWKLANIAPGTGDLLNSKR